MANVLYGRAKLVSQLSALAQRLGRSRSFSTPGSSGSDEPKVAVRPLDAGPRTVWPDENMGPFGPQDQRFQLPGNVGFDCHLEGTTPQRKLLGPQTVPDVLSSPSSGERHEFVLAQFITEFQGKEGTLLNQVRKAEHYFDHLSVQCSIKSCPELLKIEFESVFPAAPTSPITLVTVTQRNQIVGYENLDQDKELLLDNFVSGAKEICFALWTAGFWADFIDPDSGLAFFGSQSEQTLLVTQEPWHRRGFHIKDMGACKLILHVLKEKHPFVGTLFTSAPPNSLIMEKLQGLSSGLEC